MKKLLLSLFLAAILFSCKSDDYTCPDIAYGGYSGTLYIYETRKNVECAMSFDSDKRASFRYTTPQTGERQIFTTFSCKNSQIILDSQGMIGQKATDLKGVIPLKYTYDAKRKVIKSVDDDENTVGDVVVVLAYPR